MSYRKNSNRAYSAKTRRVVGRVAVRASSSGGCACRTIRARPPSRISRDHYSPSLLLCVRGPTGSSAAVISCFVGRARGRGTRARLRYHDDLPPPPPLTARRPPRIGRGEHTEPRVLVATVSAYCATDLGVSCVSINECRYRVRAPDYGKSLTVCGENSHEPIAVGG